VHVLQSREFNVTYYFQISITLVHNFITAIKIEMGQACSMHGRYETFVYSLNWKT
jgi:hypothetical protein